MDFNPDHDKWRFCCCNILTGLKICSCAEILVSLICSIVVAFTCYNSLKLKVEDTELIFDFGLLTICLLMFFGSILLLVGILIYQEKLMYLTLAARVALLIFMSAFGVSRFVLGHSNKDTGHQRIPSKRRPGPFENEKGEPVTAVRLLFLIFFMLVISAAVFYSIYLVVRGIRFVSSFKKLQDRRQSLILASQIDPELLDKLRRQSQQ